MSLWWSIWLSHLKFWFCYILNLRLCFDCSLPHTYIIIFIFTLFYFIFSGFWQRTCYPSLKVLNLGNVAENVLIAYRDDTESHLLVVNGRLLICLKLWICTFVPIRNKRNIANFSMTFQALSINFILPFTDLSKIRIVLKKKTTIMNKPDNMWKYFICCITVL